jgi:hypothetical protein
VKGVGSLVGWWWWGGVGGGECAYLVETMSWNVLEVAWKVESNIIVGPTNSAAAVK